VTDAAQAGRAQVLRGLHGAPEVLVLVNAWDVASARAVVAAGGKADRHRLALGGRRARLPRRGADPARGGASPPWRASARRWTSRSRRPGVGYDDAGQTARLALEAGAVGCNLEDGRAETGHAARAVAEVVAAGAATGVPLVVNARTDAFLLARPEEPRASLVAEAVQRGRAFAAEGADCVFVPGVADRETIEALLAGLDGVPLSVLAGPGAPPAAELQELGVARVSYGPWTLRVALGALTSAAEAVLAGGALPDGVPRTP
jgi:2-methylisocitrate lyase-like PEP mutase family enzyme